MRRIFIRRVTAFALALALAATLAGCGGAPASSASPAAVSGAGSGAPPASSAPAPAPAEGTAAEEDRGLAGLFTAFAATTSGGILDAGDNSCYSPASLYFALALVSAGAEGETLDQLLALLGAEDAEALNRQMGQAMAALPFDGYQEALEEYKRGWTDLPAGLSEEELKEALPEAGSRLDIGNSAWLNSLLYADYAPQFAAVAARDYQAALEHLPFGAPATDQALNGWVRENTGGLIDPGLQTDPAMGMMLVNTLYVLDRWDSVFNPEQNTTEPFDFADGSSEDREYMNKTLSNHRYYAGEGFTAASLAMDHGSMTFILPDEGTSPAELLATPEGTAALLAAEDPRPAEVIFQVPRFKFETELEPLEALAALGCEAPFDPALAQFPNLAEALGPEQALYIGDILQQTTIRVDEEGAEAAAMTIIALPTAAVNPVMEEPPVIELRLTRPFIFVLWRRLEVGGKYQGQVPLFVGVVNDPVYDG